uniref:RRM domain-containing protein n=1 Tax=Rhinolophus ferrumequinum TaxID=59479 RepID=A0A671EA14_RHIFE
MTGSQGMSLQGTTALRTTGWPVVFVRKIPWTMVSSELREHFVQFGHARKCIVPFDKETGFHRAEKFIIVLQLENPITDGVKFHVQPQRQKISQGDQTSDEEKDI